MCQPQNTKVLAVDDDAMMLGIMETALKDQGYQVETAQSGLVALEKAWNWAPDVILLDVIMPDITGFEVAQKIKSDQKTSGISIIMVTGLGSIEDRVKGLEAGADDFLSKPFNLDELLVRVHSLARLKYLQDKLAQKEAQCPSEIDKERSNRPVILVVEDDIRIVNICRNVLGASGYLIESAVDAEAALEAVLRLRPDLIILDLMLPGRDGLELLSELRKQDDAQAVPVIILTALGDLKTKIKGFYLGADDFLVKPLSSMELVARVKANLRKYDCQRRLSRKLQETFIQATTDHLTGLYNRRYLESVLEREMALHRRSGQPLSLMMIDIDDFKKINDNFGHQSGDEVLRALAEVFKKYLRAGDLAVRWGGDEFLILLPNTPLKDAIGIGERIRGNFVQKFAALGPKATMSQGLACMAEGEDAENLMRRLDEALYRAKGEGKNRMVA